MKVDIKFKPFALPTHVCALDPCVGFFYLEDLDAETLEILCEEFTESVFKEAGKKRPPVEAQG